MALSRHIARSRRRLEHRDDPPPWRAVPHREIQQRIGSFLREQYEPPKDLPHNLLTLMLQVNKAED
jgi:hypothetical protein